MIGIVTPLKVNNYGTKLQAYAVQKKLSKLGYSSEIIVYNPRGDIRISVVLKKIFNPQNVADKLKALYNKKQLKRNGIFDNIVERNKAINSLDEKCYCCCSPIKGYGNLKAKGQKYEMIVCGSDQVWNPEAIQSGYSSVEFISGIPKIAFSPSFGVSEIPANMIPRYKAFLDDFTFLSCREKSGVDLIKKITGKNVEVTIDPTLTLTQEDWQDFCKYAKIQIPNEPYIFCYLLGNNSKHREIIKYLKKVTGCKIITMPHFKGYVECDSEFADENLYKVNPADFIKLIANARYVCTDSFHGTVFSNIFSKDFFVFERYKANDKKSTNSRIHSLLEILNIEERLILEKDEIEAMYNKRIDFSMVHERLKEIRNKTDNYLLTALEQSSKKEINHV